MKTKKIYELHYLSAEFYDKYNSSDYPEIEHKAQRPYIVLLIKVDNNTFALPLRTNIKHSSCYKFQYSSRPTDSITGIDFSKAVIVNEASYIGKTAEIDNKEYVELNDRIQFIISKFRTYIRGYRTYVAGKANEYQAMKYKYTTLKYFHSELFHKSEPAKLDDKINDAQKKLKTPDSNNINFPSHHNSITK